VKGPLSFLSSRVKEYGEGKPWIFLELAKEPDLPSITPGFLGFDLKDGTTYEQATEIATFLNDNITAVSHTRFLADIGQTKPF
jgi:hypothetical protein